MLQLFGTQIRYVRAAIRSCIQKGTDARKTHNEFGTLLHYAGFFRPGESHLVRFILSYGVDIDATNVKGSTALHVAAKEANMDFVRALLKNKANVNAQDNFGYTPLHVANSERRADVAEFLIRSGARKEILSKDNLRADFANFNDKCPKKKSVK